MLIGKDEISNDVITPGTCFSMFAYIRADWRKSDSSVEGKPKGNWRWNSNSRDVVVCCPSFPTPPPQSPGELAPRLSYNFATGIPVPLIWEFHREVQNSLWMSEVRLAQKTNS